MKSLKIVLALVLVLAMTGTTFAAFSFNVVDQGSPSPGLTSYMVQVTEGTGFSNISVSGPVHQMWYYAGFPLNAMQTTPITGGYLQPGITTDADTHLMLVPPAVPGDPETLAGMNIGASPSNNFLDDESNDGLNLYGVNDGFGNVFTMGMGTYVTGAAEGFTLPGPTPANTDFMQIVIPTGALVYLDMDAAYSLGGENVGSQHILVGVPEPSTILMLLVGSLCLLAVRSRK